jgi:hypothetical protein
VSQKVKPVSQPVKQAFRERQILSSGEPLSGPVERDLSLRNDGLWLTLAREGDEP